MEFSRGIFWDSDPSTLDVSKNSDYIIERVVGYGTWEDWRKLLDIYGNDKVKNSVVRIKSLDPRTMSFLSLYFQLPNEAFVCSTLRQSNPVHYPS